LEIAPSTWRTSLAVGVLSMNEPASLAQLSVPNFLHHEIASEATGRLDDDGWHAVALDPFENGGKPGTGVDGIRTAHGRVVEFGHHFVPGARSERLDGFALTTVAVLIGTDVGRRGSSEVSNRNNFRLI
jgi:hypothetical protein